MPHARLLLLLLLVLLLGAETGRAPSLCHAASLLGCLRSALAAARQEPPEENAVVDKRGFTFPARQDSEEEREGNGEPEEELGKRTFPGQGRSKDASPARGKGKPSQSRAASERRAKVTLSLDVPTDIMNILFHIAKAKNLRAKAAANAHLMAQIGRRK